MAQTASSAGVGHGAESDEGCSIAASARLAGINDSTLRKAIAAGRIAKPDTTRQAVAPAATDQSTKSQRSRTDAQAAAAIGTACTRTLTSPQ